MINIVMVIKIINGLLNITLDLEKKYAPIAVMVSCTTMLIARILSVFRYPCIIIGFWNTFLYAPRLNPRGFNSPPVCCINKLPSLTDAIETYPDVKRFMDELVEQGKQKGYVTSLFGRIRPIPEFASKNFMQRQFGERIAMNSPIQGTAADIIKIAMIRVHKKLKEGNYKSRLILQIHDELLIETHKDEIDEVKRILETEMVHACDLAVPLIAEVKQGINWYEAK